MVNMMLATRSTGTRVEIRPDSEGVSSFCADPTFLSPVCTCAHSVNHWCPAGSSHGEHDLLLVEAGSGPQTKGAGWPCWPMMR